MQFVSFFFFPRQMLMKASLKYAAKRQYNKKIFGAFEQKSLYLKYESGINSSQNSA